MTYLFFLIYFVCFGGNMPIMVTYSKLRVCFVLTALLLFIEACNDVT